MRRYRPGKLQLQAVTCLHSREVPGHFAVALPMGSVAALSLSGTFSSPLLNLQAANAVGVLLLLLPPCFLFVGAQDAAMRSECKLQQAQAAAEHRVAELTRAQVLELLQGLGNCAQQLLLCSADCCTLGSLLSVLFGTGHC